MKNWILALSILTSFGAKAQHKNELTPSHHCNELGVHGAVGWSNFSSLIVLNLDEPGFNPSAGIHWRCWLSKQLALYSTSDYVIIEGSASVPTSKLTNRLTSIQLATQAEFLFTKNQAKSIISIKGGPFVGRFIDQLFRYQDKDGMSGQSKPIGTFKDWNGGITLGMEVGYKLGTSQKLALYGQYDYGILNILLPKEPLGAGNYTRAYRLGISYNFL